MFRPRRPLLAAGAFILILLIVTPVLAQQHTHNVSVTGPYTSIEDALAQAEPGDIIEVDGGTYPAPLFIEKTVTLRGVNAPVIDGEGEGSLVIITAPDVLFEGFTVRNTGTQMHHEDSGIVIQADNVTVADNIVEDVLFGIYFADADNGIARNNLIRGRADLDIAMRGDGIRVWFSNNVRLEGNEIDTTRDTLIWYANGIQIIDNNFHDNRYGLHFMYSSDAIIEGNAFEDNHVGTYLMYSQNLLIRNNILSRNRGPSGYGLALKDMDEVEATGNLFIGNRAGLYIDNSPSRYEGYNHFRDNFFAYNDIGVTTLPAVERNLFQANTFLENLQQVGTRGRGDLQGNIWSEDGRGNYWSDYVGYDLDGNGIGDMAYRSEKLFDSLTDTHPELRLFIYSPASQALDFAAAAFPALRPEPKLVDDTPLTHYHLPNIPVGMRASTPGGLGVLSAILIVLGGLPFLTIRYQRRELRELSAQGVSP